MPPSARRALHREAARHLVATGHRPIDAVAHLGGGALVGVGGADLAAVQPVP
ncbi:hypothetical protein [Streptomyces fumanus]|uniref:hypothetical protein n=1 Tax=Streptomyces fumanus TaxID=67302 RepID=UPI0033CF1178